MGVVSLVTGDEIDLRVSDFIQQIGWFIRQYMMNHALTLLHSFFEAYYLEEAKDQKNDHRCSFSPIPFLVSDEKNPRTPTTISLFLPSSNNLPPAPRF